MSAITPATKEKTERQKPGPKRTGKKYASYFLTPELIETISQQENVSFFVENTLRKALKMKKI